MKVIEIRKSEYKDTKGNPRVSYWTKFDGEPYQLFTPAKPLFTEGSDIPKESLELKQRTGKDPYYVIPDKPKEEKPADKVTPTSGYVSYKGRDEDATDARTVLMQAVEIYKFTHQIKPVTMDEVEFKELGEIASRLNGFLVLLRNTREKK